MTDFLDILKQIAIGVQDNAYKNKNDSLNFNDFEFIETRSHKFPAGHSVFTFNDSEECVGYKNVRIVSDLSKVEKMEFEIGGQKIDETFPSLLKEDYPFSCFQETVIPYLKNHDTKIYATSEEDVIIEYDFVKLHKDPNAYRLEGHHCYESWIHYYVHKSIPMKSMCVKIPFNFNNLTSDVLVQVTTNSVKDMYLEFMNKPEYRIYFKKIGDVWYCNLRELNLSRLDSGTLNYDTGGEKHTVNIIAKNLNILRTIHGMSGLAYTR
jgi:hypothetical protein